MTLFRIMLWSLEYVMVTLKAFFIKLSRMAWNLRKLKEIDRDEHFQLPSSCWKSNSGSGWGKPGMERSVNIIVSITTLSKEVN